MTTQEIKDELKKCKDSPYYFATKYCTINGQPFTTMLSEKEFNSLFKLKKEFVPPTVDEVVAYFLENGYTEASARKAHEYYRLGNWHDSNGKPVLAWKQKMHIVFFKPENKIQSGDRKMVY